MNRAIMLGPQSGQNFTRMLNWWQFDPPTLTACTVLYRNYTVDEFLCTPLVVVCFIFTSFTMPEDALHPYYPNGSLLSGGIFIANDWDVATLILAFAAASALILAVTLVVVRKANANLKASDQALVVWFVLCKYFPGMEKQAHDVLTMPQPAPSISSSKGTLSSTTPAWRACRTSSASCGRSTHCLIPDTCPPTPSCCAWRP
jgi:hypothetical protein